MRTDLEIAQFDADHGVTPGRALAAARQARRARPSIDGDDVLAWALERNGRCAEALPYSRRALRLGTHDALKFFHRGMIERCLGHESRPWFVKAVRLNPHFSVLWAPAREEVCVVKRLALLLGLVAALAAPAAASAHPLGNFTVNRFSGIELSGDRALRQVRPGHGRDPDLPGAADDHGRAGTTLTRIGRGLELTVDGRRVALTPLDAPRSRSRPGGRPAHARFEAVYVGPRASRRRLELRDTNFANRIGWKEVVLVGASARRLPRRASATSSRAYPKDLLSSPLEVTTRDGDRRPATAPAPPMLESRARRSRAPPSATGDGGFASLDRAATTSASA